MPVRVAGIVFFRLLADFHLFYMNFGPPEISAYLWSKLTDIYRVFRTVRNVAKYAENGLFQPQECSDKI